MKSAQLDVHEGKFIITVDRDSLLLSPVHRIYLVNVMGFTYDPKGRAFEYALEDNGRLIEEIYQYLKSNSIDVTLERGARNVLEAISNDQTSLDSSREIGTSIKSRPTKNLEVPGFIRELKKYQMGAVEHLVKVAHCANFSVPGSGKTSVTLAAYSVLREQGKLDAIVVIGPIASFLSWEEEFRLCFGRNPKSVRVLGPKSRRKRALREDSDPDLYLMTYQMVTQEIENVKYLLQRKRCLLVLDESHNIKRIGGGKWADAVIKIAPHARKRVILSGTPMPHSILDIWSQFGFLWPSLSLFGSKEQFIYRASHNQPDITGEVKANIGPLYWRTRKSDLALPLPSYHKISVSMATNQQSIYDALGAKVLAEVVRQPEEREKLRLWRKARMVRLLQTASNPSLLTQYSDEFRMPPLKASGLTVDQIIRSYSDFETPKKFEVAEELIRKLVAKGEKVLVWTAFVHNIRMLSKVITDLHPRMVYGDIPKFEADDTEINREKMLKQFKFDPAYKVLIANPSACSESVSLQRVCRHAIYLDRTFNGAHYMQSLDRIHRIGLTRSEKVHYYFLIAKGSIDEVIHNRLIEKHAHLLELLDDDFSTLSLDRPLGELSEETEEDKDFKLLLSHLENQYS